MGEIVGFRVFSLDFPGNSNLIRAWKPLFVRVDRLLFQRKPGLKNVGELKIHH